MAPFMTHLAIPARFVPFSLAVLAAVLFVARSAAATPFDPAGEDWEGLSQLVHLAETALGGNRVVVTSALDIHDLSRDDGIILVHPERFLDVDELSAFMRAGGRLALLDDYGSGDSLLTRFGIRRVPMPSRPLEMLRGNPSLAIAEPASAHSAVRDVSRVVTNHATGLVHPALSPVLVVRGDGEPDVLLSLAGSVGQGRLLVVSDASVAINVMMRYPGNRAFSSSMVRYLTEEDTWGKRGGKLYILANDFKTTGSFGDDAPMGTALGNARRTLSDALEMLRHDGLPSFPAYLLALAVGLGIVAWTTTRAGRPHKRVVPRFVRQVSTAAQGGVAGHAAIIGAPGTSRVLAILELKSAVEEDLATRLGLDRPPSHDELVAMVRSKGLLDEGRTRELARLLATLTRIESQLVTRRRGAARLVRDADVVATAALVRELLEAASAVRP